MLLYISFYILLKKKIFPGNKKTATE